MAVASEPSIFWRGEDAEKIISEIEVPLDVGKLVPADAQFNGPSGIALDEQILEPLSLKRKDAWLCDLVPHSCANPGQIKAIERSYLPIVAQHKLPIPSVPTLPNQLTDQIRRKAILREIIESKAKILILLGDLPIKWFLNYFDTRWKKLSDFGDNSQSYGILHHVLLDGHEINVLPLAHPRQIAKLGQSSQKWYDIHQVWLITTTNTIIQSVIL